MGISRDISLIAIHSVDGGGGGGGGTTNYNALSNKPQIGGVTLTGNKSASNLGLASSASLDGKVDKVAGKGLSTNDYTNADKDVVDGVGTALDGKVDKVTGKGLSTNDYTKEDKTKLTGLVDIQSIGTGLNLNTSTGELSATGAAITIDTEMSDSSVNPVQNKVITEALGGKVDAVSGKGLSENDYTDADKAIVGGVTSALADKVDKVSGKGLSTNDYDATAKTKLDGLSNIKSIGTGLNLNTSTGELSATGAAITIDTEMSSTSVNPVQNKVITSALDDKVDKNGTDRLMTAAEGTKLAGIEAGAEVNTIETVTLNGTAVSPDANRNIALTVITNAVNDLINYYKKTETYTKTEVDSLISAISTIHFEVVATLPTTDIQTNVIYLVPKSPAQTSNVKDEYINLDGTSAGWEKIGDTDIDLSDYITTTELNTALADYTTTANLTTLLAGKVDVVSGKGLSTNDYDNTAKGIVDGVTAALADKVDKVSGKGLSTNDYDNTAKTIVDGVTSALSGKVDKVTGKGLSTNDYTAADKAIVDGVTSALSGKVDKVTGKGLSTNDFDNVYMDKLSYLAEIYDVGDGLVLTEQGELYSSLPGKKLEAEMVRPVPGDPVEAGAGAEIFNDYRDRTFSGTDASAGNVASGEYSHAEGALATAMGNYSHAEGYCTMASGNSAHAEGWKTKSSTGSSHAEGYYTTASGNSSHAEGMSTTASGDVSHAEGDHTTARSSYTHAEGYYTTAGYSYQHVSGKYNDNKTTTLLEVGNGTGSNAKSNAFEVYTDGHINVNGDIYQNGSKLSIMTIPYQKSLGAYNLLDNTWSTSVISGVTVTRNADDTLSTSGTSSAADDQEIGVATLKAGTYKLVGCPTDGGSATYRLKAVNKTSSNTVIGYDDGEGLTITLAADATVGVNLVFASSVPMTGLTFKPMITPDAGAAYADYIPYAMTNKELTETKAGISVTTTDPGEGTALSDNTLLVVVEE